MSDPILVRLPAAAAAPNAAALPSSSTADIPVNRSVVAESIPDSSGVSINSGK